MKLLAFIVFIYISSSIFSLTTKKFILNSQDPNIEKFQCNKQNIQKMVDPRFGLKYLMDNVISKDKTLRFLTTDTRKSESVYSKLYFKGDPKQCQFNNQGANPSFADALEDCNNHRTLIARLYNRKPENESPITDKDKPIFSSVALPQCISDKQAPGSKTHYMNTFSLPSGEDMASKCLVGKFLNRETACFIHLRKVSTAVLKALKVFNSGNRFYRHGNLSPENIYLYEKRDIRRVFIDNMLYDSVKYDDKNNKPFKSDFNMLADTLVSLVTGSATFKLKSPKNTFHIYAQIKKYFKKNQFPVDLRTYHLNIPKKFMSTPKCVTLAELEYLLRDTFFNFVYRLKCTATNKPYRFVEIDQALKHGFLFVKKESQTWDSLPAEF